MLIRAITANKGKTLDRYTVYFWDGICLTLSTNPDSPQGVSMMGDTFGINDSDFETGAVSGDKMINFYELPSVVQAHIEKRIADSK